jgi:hypothetical protein
VAFWKERQRSNEGRHLSGERRTASDDTSSLTGAIPLFQEVVYGEAKHFDQQDWG